MTDRLPIRYDATLNGGKGGWRELVKGDAAWLSYRQGLRDVTEPAKDKDAPTNKSKENPDVVVFPVME